MPIGAANPMKNNAIGAIAGKTANTANPEPISHRIVPRTMPLIIPAMTFLPNGSFTFFHLLLFLKTIYFRLG